MRKVLFGFVWFIVLYFLACMGMGAVAGGIAGYHSPNATVAQKAGRKAGEMIVAENIGYIVGGSLTLSILGSAAGILPGTRSRAPRNQFTY